MIKEEIDPETGEKRKVTVDEYNYEKELEPVFYIKIVAAFTNSLFFFSLHLLNLYCILKSYSVSVLKAFKRWLSEGYYPFLIVDNVNGRVSDFEPYCVAAKAAGYEVYILQLNGDHQVEYLFLNSENVLGLNTIIGATILIVA